MAVIGWSAADVNYLNSLSDNELADYVADMPASSYGRPGTRFAAPEAIYRGERILAERRGKIKQQLENQYNNIVKLEPGAAYGGRSSDIDKIFSYQAAILDKAGVKNILDIKKDGNKVVDKRTGKTIANLSFDRDTKVTKWGDYGDVKGVANFGISFAEDGSPVFYPVYEKNKSPLSEVGLGGLESVITPILTIAGGIYGVPGVGAIAGAGLGAAAGNTVGQLLASGEVDFDQVIQAGATAAALSPGSTGAVGDALGLSKDAAKIAGGAVIGAGISELAGGDALKGAIAGAVGAVGSTTYATQVGNALNVTGAAAPIVGNAVINAGLSGIAAAATGGNIEKSMLDGAIKGAAVAGSTEFANAVLGKDNVASIAKAAGLEEKQIANIFTTSVANGVTAEISGQGEFLETVGISLAAQGVGAKSADLMKGAMKDVLDKDPEIMAGVLTATNGIAQTATSAALQGIDVGEALERTAPGIILSSVQAYQAEADRQDEIRRKQEEAAAAQREKDLVAAQQPQLVAGPAQALSELETVLQVAANRGEQVTSLGEQDGVQSFQVTGTRDDGSTYSYQILSSPEIGIRYEFGSVPVDPLSGRVDPTRPLQTTVSQELPEFRDNPTIGVPTQPIPDAAGGAVVEPVLSQQLRDAALSTLIENELRQLEEELRVAEQRQTQARTQATQAEQQFQRLSELPTGRGIGQDIASQLEEELSGLEESARMAEEEARTLGEQRERIGSLADAEGDAGLSDQDLLTFLQTGDLPGGRGRLLGEEGAPEGAPEGTPEGEGTEPGAGEGGAGEGGAGEGGAGEGEGGAGELRTPLRPSLIFDRETGGRPETTPFASRVTGEALASILGEKEPLFGGDEDEQRAVWNRRSLRLLSRALGL